MPTIITASLATPDTKSERLSRRRELSQELVPFVLVAWALVMLAIGFFAGDTGIMPAI